MQNGHAPLTPCHPHKSWPKPGGAGPSVWYLLFAEHVREVTQAARFDHQAAQPPLESPPQLLQQGQGLRLTIRRERDGRKLVLTPHAHRKHIRLQGSGVACRGLSQSRTHKIQRTKRGTLGCRLSALCLDAVRVCGVCVALTYCEPLWCDQPRTQSHSRSARGESRA